MIAPRSPRLSAVERGHIDAAKRELRRLEKEGKLFEKDPDRGGYAYERLFEALRDQAGVNHVGQRALLRMLLDTPGLSRIAEGYRTADYLHESANNFGPSYGFPSTKNPVSLLPLMVRAHYELNLGRIGQLKNRIKEIDSQLGPPRWNPQQAKATHAPLRQERSELVKQLETAEADHAARFANIDPRGPGFLRQFLNDNSALFNAEKLRVLSRAFGAEALFNKGNKVTPRVGLVIADLPAKDLSAREPLSFEIPALKELEPRDIQIAVKPKTALTSHFNMAVSAALSKGARPKVWLTHFENISDISAAIQGGAKVVSISVHHANPESFQRLAQLMEQHPDVMFVQAAGNDREQFAIGRAEKNGLNPFAVASMWEATKGQPISNWVLVGGHYLSDGKPWEQSGTGNGVFISAPMAKVVERGSTGYREWTALGTSRATPSFAGTAICMLEIMAGIGRYKKVGLLPRDTLRLIELSANKDARFEGLNKVAGRLNHERALAFTGALRTMVNADHHFGRKLSVHEAAKAFNLTLDEHQEKAMVALAEEISKR
ncbi:MAG: S8/S53 family peptidase [Myxococcaceae bacterium]|nr:S8/S53 family peptidase [Myxococcaceae bacterium]